MKIELCMAEFGETRGNSGDATLPVDRLEPSLSSFLRHFPEAPATVYTDQPWESTGRVRVVTVDPPFDRKHARYGNRANDLYEPIGMLESTADIAIGIDSDLLIVNESVRTLIPLVERFHLCAPSNGRHIVWRDARSPLDGGKVADPSGGCGMCHCTALMALDTKHQPSRDLLSAYCGQIRADADTNRGARGPLSLWRASWRTGIAPYTLPREWCVTGSNLGDVEAAGRTVPIVLHVGHQTVADHYRDLVEKWR